MPRQPFPPTAAIPNGKGDALLAHVLCATIMSSTRWLFGFLRKFVLAGLGVAGAAWLLTRGEVTPFMPHAHCYLFDRGLILLHGSSDLLIGSAYVGISATLIYLVQRAKREMPFHWMMLAFAVFIVACGATHLMEVWTLQAPHPRYWLSGYVKLITAIASVSTAVLLPRLIPKVLVLLKSARTAAERKVELESAYAQLADAHEKVKQLDQMRTNFFANVSHELRTPLSLILGPIDRMLESPKLGAAERQSLEVVQRNALMLHKHVNDLLDLSRFEAGKLEAQFSRVDLAGLARRMGAVFDGAIAEKQVNFTIETPPALPAEVDADKVQRVLINLLSNALKFVPENGAVRLAISQTGEVAEIRIEDSGPGVAPDLREAIFDRFHQGDHTLQQQRSGGTGLGLSIVREFVQLHGGSVRAEEAAIGGAAFVVHLPLRAPAGAEVHSSDNSLSMEPGLRTALETAAGVEATRVRTANEEEGKEEAGANFGDTRPLALIVEDNCEMNDFIAQVLAAEFRTISAFNGRQGLEMAKDHLPDLILTDLMMPEMSGDELIQAVRGVAELATTPVILLTASGDLDLKMNLLAEGAQDYLTKPFAVAELRARAHNQVTAKLVRDTLQRELASQDNDIAQLATEVTQRARQLERAKEVAEEANQAKDHFLAVLSHELRTPLTPVLAAAIELEAGGGKEPEQLRHALQLIRRNIELEARLIDDLLDFTKISKGKLQLQLGDVDLHQAIRGALEICQNDLTRKELQLAVALEASSAHVRGDAARLLQIFWNLILNAVKFTPPHGQISVRTTNTGEGQIRVEVSDSGVGIEAEAMPRIFEAFTQGEQSVTRRFGGLGLGLTIAKGLTAAHGGRMLAMSEGTNRGTTMTVELPLLAPASIGAVAAPLETSPADTLPLRILLVEDHDDTRHAMTRLLQRWGYVVRVASTLREAIGAADVEQFDVLISDLGLPDGHGTELLREIRKKSEMLAIAMSGFGMEQDLRQTQEAGFLAHLVKPIAAQKLRVTIEAATAAQRR